MTLTKQQDALATKLRDAGVPGVFAVLVASRNDTGKLGEVDGERDAIAEGFYWHEQPEQLGFWGAFDDAWVAEFDHMEATGVRYDD